jgi:adenylate cyclase
MSDIRTVINWLSDGARSAQLSEDVLEELCRGMVEAGIPLWRVAVFVTTLHPDLMGRAFRWWSEAGVKGSEAQYDVKETDDYLKSPVVAVYGTRQPLRRTLAHPNCPIDFAVLNEFRTEGATDYVAFPLVFTDGSIHVATWSTRQPGGFTPKQYTDLEQVIAPLTRVAEIRALRRTATNLLNTYVGRQAGERILAGRIRRGHVEAIHAAIWLSDMRGFTTRSERLPPQELINLLNRYFDCQVPAILNSGGEVLKFIGDGLLATFPLSGDRDDANEVCRRALTCAREAEAAIAALDPPARRQSRCDPLRPGAAYRASVVRQHRRRQPARLHLHRAGGEPRGAAGKARFDSRAEHRRVCRVCRPGARRICPAGRVSRGGLRRAAEAVRV